MPILPVAAVQDLLGGPNKQQAHSYDVPEWDPGSGAKQTLYYQEGTDWDYVTLRVDGEEWKFWALVEGDKDTRLDVKQTPGVDGASLGEIGVSPAQVVIRLRFLEPWALGEWAGIRPHLQPDGGKPRKDAVSVYHPGLAINGIKELYLKALGVPRVTAPGGPVEVVTRWLEFLPPKKGGVHMVGSDSSSVGKGGKKKVAESSGHGASPSTSTKAKEP